MGPGFEGLSLTHPTFPTCLSPDFTHLLESKAAWQPDSILIRLQTQPWLQVSLLHLRTLQCLAPNPHTQGCFIFRLLRDLIGWCHEGAATAQRATGLHTQPENRFNKHLLSPCCVPAVWTPPALECCCPSFEKPHPFPAPPPQGSARWGPPELPGWLMDPRFQWPTSMCLSQRPSRALHVVGARVSSCDPKVTLCSPVPHPSSHPGPDSSSLRPRPWGAGRATCPPRRLAEFAAHRPGF